MKFDLSLLKKYTIETPVCCEKHPDADLYIYGYYFDHTSNKKMIWDDISINCRGMILDSKGNIVERTFPKFWTYKQYLTKETVLLSENKIIKIPHGKFRILEKIDGTMVTLYWIGDRPYLATQRSFTNIKAIEATKILHEKYEHLFPKLNKKYTYIFEAIYPETKVLIDYGDKRDLVLIGMINKETAKPMDLPDLGFPICRDFTPIYGQDLNFDQLIDLNIPNQEGFVVYFETGLMIKLKFTWYQNAHRILDSFFYNDKISYLKYNELMTIMCKIDKKTSNIDIWDALENGDFNLLSIRAKVPGFYYLMGFDYWLEQEKNTIIQLYKDYTQISKPNEIKIFDIHYRMTLPHIYETIVWNWEKRYLNI